MDIEVFTICGFAQDMMGKLTVVGTFDTVLPPQLPFQLPTCSIAARIRLTAREAGRIPFGVKITSPDGGYVIPPIMGEMMVQPPPGAESITGNLCVGIGMLKLTAYGRYNVTLSLRGQDLRTLPLFVNRHPQQETQHKAAA